MGFFASPAPYPFRHGWIPKLIVAAGRRQIALYQTQERHTESANGELAGYAGRLCALNLIRMLIGGAMVEGAAFFALVSYLVEGRQERLLLAALLVAVMALKLPTRARVER